MLVVVVVLRHKTNRAGPIPGRQGLRAKERLVADYVPTGKQLKPYSITELRSILTQWEAALQPTPTPDLELALQCRLRLFARMYADEQARAGDLAGED